MNSAMRSGFVGGPTMPDFSVGERASEEERERVEEEESAGSADIRGRGEVESAPRSLRTEAESESAPMLYSSTGCEWCMWVVDVVFLGLRGELV